MQTQKPAVSLLSTLNSNAPQARQGGGNAKPDISFNQVLSREVARQPERPAVHDTPPAPQNVNKAQENADKNSNSGPLPPQNQAQNADNANTQNASGTNATNNGNNNANNGNASTKAQDGSSADKADDKSAAELAQGDAAAATTLDPTAALLALVASFNTPQATAGKAAPVAEAQVASVATAGSKSDKTTDALSRAVAATDSKGEKAQDPFARLLPADAKAAPESANLDNAAAPKAATAKAEPATQLSGNEARAEVVPQQAANAENLSASAQGARAGAQGAKAINLGQQTQGEGNTQITGVAQASAAANTPAIAKLQTQLAPRVGNPGWDQALGQHVVYMASSGTQTASMTLNPPDLGPLQVTLHISNDQASASFTAAQPEVRAALEAAMPKLREMMSEAGISLGNATVSTNLPNQQQQSGQGEQSQRQSGGQFDNSSNDEIPRTVVTRSISQALGMVDTFV